MVADLWEEYTRISSLPVFPGRGFAFHPIDEHGPEILHLRAMRFISLLNDLVVDPQSKLHDSRQVEL